MHMPDLSSKGAHTYWYTYKDNMIYRVVSFMEGVEDWTLDGDPQFEEAMQNLAKTLDKVGSVNLEKEAEIIRVAVYLKAARMLMLLQAFDVANPGSASKIIMYAEKNTTSPDDLYGLFVQRNIVFERLRLLGRIFSPQRLDLLTKAFEDRYHE
jgi:intracellular multiplication protein IcmW